MGAAGNAGSRRVSQRARIRRCSGDFARRSRPSASGSLNRMVVFDLT